MIPYKKITIWLVTFLIAFLAVFLTIRWVKLE